MKPLQYLVVLLALTIPAFGQAKSVKVNDAPQAKKPESVVLTAEQVQPWENLQLRVENARKDLQIAQMSVQMAQTQITAADKAAAELLESLAEKAGISRLDLASYDFSRTPDGSILIKLKPVDTKAGAKPDTKETKKE